MGAPATPILGLAASLPMTPKAEYLNSMMSQNTYCPGCGSKRTAEARFCATCGTEFVAPVPGASMAEPPLAESDRPPRSTIKARLLGQPIHRPTAIGIGVLSIALVASLIWAGTTAKTLSSTQIDLAASARQLVVTTSDVVAGKSRAAALGADNAQLVVDKTKLTSDAVQIRSQVSRQTECISALQANATELQRISELATANFNRAAKGSAWAKAKTNAINDYYKAYSAAFDGRLSTANSWIAKGNAAIKTEAAQTKIINAATKKIEAAETELATAIRESGLTCGF
jgi:hypothetical protein